MTRDIAFVTAFSPTYTAIAEITLPRMAAAAKAAGATFYSHALDYNGRMERPLGWMKIPLLRQALEEHAAVWYIDADVLLCREITHRDLDAWFFDRHADLVIARDYGGSPARELQRAEFGIDAQVGSFFLRRSAWTAKLVDEWWAQDDLIPHQFQEQAALCRLLAKDRSHAQIDEQAEYNRWLRHWKPGDATCHFAGIDNRFNVIRELSLCSLRSFAAV